ncbi:MAG: spore coat protein U domain-containing protein [Pseudomonadota bacterium]|nr:spore coat protein U domain-containing protein [Pseudomonadota bacterium]
MRWRRALALPLAAAALASTPPAFATTTCSASLSNVAFGASDPFNGWADVSATLSYQCQTFGLSLLANAAVRLCLSIGDGAQGDGGITPRRMLSGASALQFNLYSDASRTQVWGTYPGNHVEVVLQYAVPLLGGSGSGSRTVYARVPANQFSAVPGTYLNSFSGIDAEARYRYDERLLGSATVPGNCTSAGDGGGTTTFPFDASATVNAACTPGFTVQDVDFGTRGLLATAVDTTATISPRCTNTTPYQIGLDDGLHAVGQQRRMRSLAGRHVGYELYRDAARTQRWGDTPNTDTVGGTGNGSVQSVTVHARVAAQATPPQGVYSDTVTVTIYY